MGIDRTFWNQAARPGASRAVERGDLEAQAALTPDGNAFLAADGGVFEATERSICRSG
jgi:hypothetical protein